MEEQERLYSSDSFEESYTARHISKAQEERRIKRDRMTSESSEKRERRRQIVRRRRMVLVLALLIVLGSFAIAGRRVVNIVLLRAEKAQAEQNLSDLEQELAAKQAELEQVNSDEYVEQQARSELKMIRPGETLYLIKDSEDKNKQKDPDSEAPDAKLQ